MHRIRTHRSGQNEVILQRLQASLEQKIDTRWRTTWYKRLRFYFFEAEIRSDILNKLQEEKTLAHSHIADPEYQALVARSALTATGSYEIWDEMTLYCNDYIFGQGEFENLDYALADEAMSSLILKALLQSSSPTVLHKQLLRMSDVLVELRRARADALIARELAQGLHSFQSLLKWCADYIGSFAMIPRFVGFFPQGRSAQSLQDALDNPQTVESLLEPQYVIECVLLDENKRRIYGHEAIEDSPYSNMLVRTGKYWSASPWFVKVALSLSIVLCSSWRGGQSLFILPILWGCLTMTTTMRNYAHTLQGVLRKRYESFASQEKINLEIAHRVLDPEKTTQETLQAQEYLSRRYEILPFSGQGCIRDASKDAKQLYHILMNFGYEEHSMTIARMEAVRDWSNKNHLSLLIVQHTPFAQQTLFRFESLLTIVTQHLRSQLNYDHEIQQHYESIDAEMKPKKYKFWKRTLRQGVSDGLAVALSSGLIGRLGSYLWNRNGFTSSTMAASSQLTDSLLAQSQDELINPSLVLERLQQGMTEPQFSMVVESINNQKHDTLWDTFVQILGHKAGNTLTNELMDQWRRISHDGQTSVLMQQAFSDPLFPLNPQDNHWDDLVEFLRRIYNYDNLAVYSQLLNQEQWLSDTLHGLSDGTMSLEYFAQLSPEQREIVTQSLFYQLKPHSLSLLFDSSVEGNTQGGGSGAQNSGGLLGGIDDGSDSLTGVVDGSSSTGNSASDTGTTSSSGSDTQSGRTQINPFTLPLVWSSAKNDDYQNMEKK